MPLIQFRYLFCRKFSQVVPQLIPYSSFPNQTFVLSWGTFSVSLSPMTSTGMKIGYARVSTTDQNLDLQEDALRAAKCEKIFTDMSSGSKTDRKGLNEALAYVRAGDTLVVWRLDRLGRSLKQLIDLVQELHTKGIHFTSLEESIAKST